MAETNLVELEFLEWLSKVTERSTTIQIKIRERIDINDDDYELLRVFHKIWFNGEHPLYKTQSTIIDEKAEQQGLFGQNDIQSANGTNLADTLVEL